MTIEFKCLDHRLDVVAADIGHQGVELVVGQAIDDGAGGRAAEIGQQNAPPRRAFGAANEAAYMDETGAAAAIRPCRDRETALRLRVCARSRVMGAGGRIAGACPMCRIVATVGRIAPRGAFALRVRADEEPDGT